MCGINGIIFCGDNPNNSISSQLTKMNELIIHRGPDDDGFFIKNTKEFSIGMAMRRLSIIDLTSGAQPMSSEDEKITIVFNGEIYNYRELKKDLIAKGVKFTTNSDTEVILKLYENFGTSAFGKLDGMFAFSIYDENLSKVFIARDFFGEKPLYYFKTNKGFYWGSELKSIVSIFSNKPSISKTGLNLYFRLTYIPAPFTIYENIFKLEANHFIEIDCKDNSYTIQSILNQPAEGIDPEIKFEEAKTKTRELVNQSVISRAVSDVPIGTFLSGGVDSSIVSAILAENTSAKIDTFSIGFEKKSFDESDKARTVAKQIQSNHHEFIIGPKDLKHHIDDILNNFDEPFADSSSLPTYLVAHKTSQHVKVALTGDGGDEVFGGYNKYYMGRLNQRYTGLIPEKIHKHFKAIAESLLSTRSDKRGKRFKAKKLLNSIGYEDDFYFNIISLAFQENEIKTLLRPDKFEEGIFDYFLTKITEKKGLSAFRNIDKLISLEGDMLVKVDRTSMLTSLESRAPFLNKTLWDFTGQLPESFLIKGWNKKYLLKESFKDYFPSDFLNKSKKGFGVPVGDWLRSDLSTELKSYANKKFIESQNIFETEEITKLVNNHLSGVTDNTFKVWAFFCFQKWYMKTYFSENLNFN
jgi:asparagine synthase (glutamine-hydrolysing)